MKTLEYKGYTGSYEHLEGDEYIHGTINNIEYLSCFQGKTLPELRADFESIVDEYITEFWDQW